MVWWVYKHLPDKRKIPIGLIYTGFYARSDLTIIFLLSGRWSWTLYLGTRNKWPDARWSLSDIELKVHKLNANGPPPGRPMARP